MADTLKIPDRLYIPIDALAVWREKAPCLPAFEPVCVGDPHKVYVLEDTSTLHVPGLWHCAKCEFQLVQSNLNANDGTITPRDTPGDKCPNCDSPLWRVSWKQQAHAYAKAFDDTWAALQILKAATESSPTWNDLTQKQRDFLCKAAEDYSKPEGAGQEEIASEMFYAVLEALQTRVADQPKEAAKGKGETAEDWMWWAGQDSESYSIGPCGSREQAIDEARDHYDGEGFHLVEARQDEIRIADQIDIERLFDEWNEELYDVIGTEGRGLDDMITTAEKSELEASLKEAADQWQQGKSLIPWRFLKQRNEEFIEGQSE